MLYIKDDDVTYGWWKEANTDGFIANLRSVPKEVAVLHRATCKHLQPFATQEATYTDSPKACSRDRNEVEQWVRQSGIEIEFCKSCKPDQ